MIARWSRGIRGERRHPGEIVPDGVDYAQGYATGKPVPVLDPWKKGLPAAPEIVPNRDFSVISTLPGLIRLALPIRKTFKKPVVARSVSIMPYSNSLIC
jgi:hypothetical protein